MIFSGRLTITTGKVDLIRVHVGLRKSSRALAYKCLGKFWGNKEIMSSRNIENFIHKPDVDREKCIFSKLYMIAQLEIMTGNTMFYDFLLL